MFRINNIFKKKKVSQSDSLNTSGELKYIVFGLGNMGPDYEKTRHNIGFEVLDYIASKKGITFQPARYGDIASFKHKGRVIILVKPSTYMNLSGKAVNYWMQKEKADISNILVITDDIALPTGTIRVKAKGSDGGHNGLANIIQVLGKSNFPRLRFGVGSEFEKGRQVDYVLGKWTDEEWKVVEPQISKSMEVVQSYATIGIERTMNFFNTKRNQPKSKELNKGESPGK